MTDRYIVIFDGVCNFCSNSVNFIIKRDPAGLFMFAPMQSNVAQRLMNRHCLQAMNEDALVLIKPDGSSLVFSSAALEISKHLSGAWFLFGVFKVLPVSFRDYFYRLFARHRYRLFGRKESCMVPTAEIKARFLSD